MASMFGIITILLTVGVCLADECDDVCRGLICEPLTPAMCNGSVILNGGYCGCCDACSSPTTTRPPCDPYECAGVRCALVTPENCQGRIVQNCCCDSCEIDKQTPSPPCGPNVCASVSCEKVSPDTCQGRIVPNGGDCGCCDSCEIAMCIPELCEDVRCEELTSGNCPFPGKIFPRRGPCDCCPHCEYPTDQCVPDICSRVSCEEPPYCWGRKPTNTGMCGCCTSCQEFFSNGTAVDPISSRFTKVAKVVIPVVSCVVVAVTVLIIAVICIRHQRRREEMRKKSYEPTKDQLKSDLGVCVCVEPDLQKIKV